MTAQVVAEGLAFPECPRWHRNRWWFADMHAGTVCSARADGRDPRIEVDLTAPGRDPAGSARTAGLGFLPDGRLLVVSALDATIRRRESDGRVVLHADLRDATRGWCNDMLVDRLGRAYVGSYGSDIAAGEAPADVRLALVSPDGTARPVGEPLSFPNGMAMTPDDRTLIVAESLAERLTAFAVARDGTLGARRVWAALPDGVRPDGIARDVAGGVWVASFATGECMRVEEGGAVTHTVVVPGRLPFACALGGHAGETLLVCAATTWDPTRTLAVRDGVLATCSAPHRAP